MAPNDADRRNDWKEISDVRSIAEKALTLQNAHEVVCSQRYAELKNTGEKVASALKYVHIGVGMCISVNFIVGLYVMLHR